MGVISNPAAFEPLDQTRNIKAPAHHPEHLRIRTLLAKAIIQVGMIDGTLAVGDQFRRAQIRHQTGGLLLNAQSAAPKPGTGARNQKADKRRVHRLRERNQAATASVLPAR